MIHLINNKTGWIEEGEVHERAQRKNLVKILLSIEIAKE
jgi:hypothetical protein